MGSRRLAGFAPRVVHPLSTQSSRTILQPCPMLAWPLPCLLQGTSSECVGHTAQSSAAEERLPDPPAPPLVYPHPLTEVPVQLLFVLFVFSE